ncbi:alkene reductase [Pseudomonas syringae]|uniref:alkene reductase n=2 Tax=Pseudomonas syringae TaxID=317 RepID=UPI000209346C|nr:alkene reductase [Pseudomonas syringae]AQL38548.1 alkene reductase [Pseudomonas syringae pv. actinidiae ICMP 9853]EGH66734.1 NADH:flavin oxidoreductase/NADH oxidase family protein [Pseudomonas syringae pv. actinidiae str. M302091]EPM51137.1 NADH:flavin oxidoreductase/NADH oxidase family protein [Pseudomonas syringae pv. actinidiae ICMP 19103]EPM86412.1 NADH:flavin oxidoreductase/NADH oxidase family protein [Pseudomonas syringae pv. actinidiae ICMP 19068]EPM95464.1 NADH:flavin oxidoreductase
MSEKALFEPYALGNLTLTNRIVMAPLTRNRAAAGLVPTDLTATYYAQRASAGLIITEATQISPQAQGYQDTPGLYTPEQIAAWRVVTDAVHAEGGRIFVQLWHVGRVSHVDLQPGGAAPVAPSAIRAQTKTFVNNAFTDVSEPRALELSELPGIVNDFSQAAANAIEAGFDGVEIHGANGYLLDQFIKDSANVRTDAYGGSVGNRARLLLEVITAVVKEIGAQRTGVRISPVSPANGVASSDPQPQYEYIAEQLSEQGIAFLHVVEGATGGPRDVAPFDYDALRQRFKHTYLANNGYDLDLETVRVNANKADLVAFGRPFISNPDLIERLKTGAPLAELNPATLYGGGAEGYTDYPTIAG